MTLAIPPLGLDDALPHDRAVWRDVFPGIAFIAGREVSVDYGAGQIEQTKGDLVDWGMVVRWRYGWPPA